MTLTVNCPTCKAPVTWDDSFPERPFCSHRCRLIDLGEWATEKHTIAGEPIYPEVGEGSDNVQ